MLFLVSVVLAFFLVSQQPALTPLPVAESLNTPGLAPPPIDLSPDGSHVAYTVRRSLGTLGLPEQDGWFTVTGVPRIYGWGGDIWITDSAGRETRNITKEQGSNWAPVWSPDGKSLAFYSDRDGATRVWIWTRDSGEIRRVAADIARPVYDTDIVRWTPDGKRLVTKLLPQGQTLADANRRITADAAPLAPERLHHPAATLRIYRGGPDVTAPTQRGDDDESQTPLLLARESADVAMVDVATGAVTRLLTNTHPRWVDVSPDGAMIGISIVTTLTMNVALNRHRLLVVPTNGSPRVLADDVEGFWWGLSASWSPDSRSIAWLTATAQASRAHAVDVGNGVIRPSGDLPPSTDVERAPLWTSSSDALWVPFADSIWRIPVRADSPVRWSVPSSLRVLELVAAPRGAVQPSPTLTFFARHQQSRRMVVGSLDTTSGSVRVLREDGRDFAGRVTLDAKADGSHVVFGVEAPGTMAALLIADQHFTTERPLTRIAPVFDQHVTGQTRLLSYTTRDGRALQASLLLPAGFEPGRRYPLIAWVYSSSRPSTNVWGFGAGEGARAQLLATRGYAVLLPDIPTTGPDEMRDIHDMVMPAVDAAVAEGVADPERLGVIGESHGGYTVMSLLVQTSRFKAAVAGAAAANLFSLYGTMRTGGEGFYTYWLERGPHGLGGSPWEARDRYIENSPAFRLDRVHTPLLLVHADLDVTIPPFLGDEIFVGLRGLGRRVTYLRYVGQEHVPARWTLPNQIDYAQRMLDWFDTHVKGTQK